MYKRFWNIVVKKLSFFRSQSVIFKSVAIGFICVKNMLWNYSKFDDGNFWSGKEGRLDTGDAKEKWFGRDNSKLC